MSLNNVRQNPTSWNLLGPHSTAYWAGQHALRRQQNMGKARQIKEESKKDPLNGGLVRMFVDFARDDHYHYLNCLCRLRQELQAATRIQNYEQTVMDRVMGVLHR